MFKKVKLGKVLAVIFLTVLVWVWADLASDEQDSVSSATISIAPSNPQDLWVSFDGGSSVSIREIILKGPAARMAEVKAIVKQEGRLKFEFDVVKEDMDEPGQHQLQLLPLLRNDSQIKQLGVKVESCKPESVPFNVTKLVKTSDVEVQCVDKSGSLINARIDPPRIEMLLPEGWRRVATVQLSPAEITQAKGSDVHVKPYVRLADDRTVTAEQNVAVTIPADELLPEEQIKPWLGIALSPSLQGKYRVDFQSIHGLVAPFNIRATAEAKSLYAGQTYQLMLEIRDGDEDYDDYQPRQLKHCFPEDALRKGEIEAAQPAPTAHFKLIPLPSVEEGPIPVPVK
jgi:hypothetical protein